MFELIAELAAALFALVLERLGRAPAKPKPRWTVPVEVRPSPGTRGLATVFLGVYAGVAVFDIFMPGPPRWDGSIDVDRWIFRFLLLLSIGVPGTLAADVWVRRAIADHQGIELRTLFGGKRTWRWDQVSSVTYRPRGQRVQEVRITFEEGDAFVVGNASENYRTFAELAWPFLVKRAEPDAKAVILRWASIFLDKRPYK